MSEKITLEEALTIVFQCITELKVRIEALEAVVTGELESRDGG